MDVFVGCFAFQLQLPLHCFSVMYTIFDYVTRFQQLRCVGLNLRAMPVRGKEDPFPSSFFLPIDWNLYMVMSYF